MDSGLDARVSLGKLQYFLIFFNKTMKKPNRSMGIRGLLRESFIKIAAVFFNKLDFWLKIINLGVDFQTFPK